MNKEDLRVYRAWHYCESVLGPTLTNELRRGRSIYIAAKNGKVYEIGPHGYVGCVTTNEFYCVHIEDGKGCWVDFHYPVPDLIVHRYDWIVHDPDKFDKVAGRDHWTLDSQRGRNMMLYGSSFPPPRRMNRERIWQAIANQEPLPMTDMVDAMRWANHAGDRIGRHLGNVFNNWR